MLSGMAALNGGLGGAGLTNGTAGTMDALTQAYSGIQQYAAAALPTLYSQSLLQQQGAAGSQKEGQWAWGGARGRREGTGGGKRQEGGGGSGELRVGEGIKRWSVGREVCTPNTARPDCNSLTGTGSFLVRSLMQQRY